MHDKLFQLLLVLVLPLFLMTSCKKDDSSAENVVFDLEDEFSLGLREVLGEGENRELEVFISSLKQFDCENYRLNSSINLINNQAIRVSVTELIEPTDCIPGMAPASTEVSIGDLVIREYPINVSLVYQIENEGTLNVHPDYYELSIQEDNGIVLAYPKLLKIPTQTIWGYISYKTDDIPVADELFQDLSQTLEIRDFEPGNYGHFQLNDSRELEFPETISTSDEIQTFFMGLKGSVEDLRQKVEETYCPQYQDKIEIKIFTSQGEAINC